MFCLCLGGQWRFGHGLLRSGGCVGSQRQERLPCLSTGECPCVVPSVGLTRWPESLRLLGKAYYSWPVELGLQQWLCLGMTWWPLGEPGLQLTLL